MISPKPFNSLFLRIVLFGMSNSNYDPQTLDHYEPFHKEFGKKEFLTMGAYTAIFAPFGWFIGIL